MDVKEETVRETDIRYFTSITPLLFAGEYFELFRRLDGLLNELLTVT